VETDANGNEKAGGSSLAPAFYGLSEEQAHRKMLTALENSFSEVTEIKGGRE
jgi:predicted sugar kinase